MHSEMGVVWQNPIQRTVRTAHLSVLMTVHSFSTQHNRNWHNFLGLCGIVFQRSDLHVWLMCDSSLGKSVYKKLLINADSQPDNLPT